MPFVRNIQSADSNSGKPLGHVPEPVRITAHQPRLLAALGGMEMAQEALDTVDPGVKALAEIKTAKLIGYPF